MSQRVIRPIALAFSLAVSVSCKTAAPSQVQTSGDDLRKFFQAFDPSEVHEQLVEEFDKLELQAGLKLFSIDRLGWAKLAGQYKVSVDRKARGSYMRSDRWRLRGSLNPADILAQGDKLQLPIRLHLHQGGEVEFLRPYDDRLEALRALPRTPVQMPLTAAAATRLKEGELVRMPSTMGVHLGLGYHAAATNYGAGGSIGVFWLGQIQVTVLRLEDSLVRLRLHPIEEQGHSLDLYGGAKLNYFGYGPFGLVNLDREIAKQLGLDLFNYVKRTTTLGQSFAFDYTYDLSQAEAVEAFDAMLHRTLKGVHPELIRMSLGRSNVADLTFADLTPSERLASRDQERDRPAVRQNAEGTTEYVSQSIGSHLGTHLLRWQGARLAGTHHLFSESAEGESEHFVLLHTREIRRQKSLIEPLRESRAFETAAYMDDNAAEPRVISLEFTYDVEDKLLATQEVNDFLGVLEAIVGEARLAKLDALSRLPRTAQNDFHASFRLAIDGAVFDKLKALLQKDRESFERLLWQTMTTIAPRVERRAGLSTPGNSSNWLGTIGNAFKKNYLTMRRSLIDAFRLRWGGVHGSTAKDIVEIMLELSDVSKEAVLQKLLWLVRKDDLAVEIVPAFFLELVESTAVAARPFVAISLGSESFPREESNLGDEPFRAARLRVLEVYRRLTAF